MGPQLLTDAQKCVRISMSRNNLRRIEKDSADFLDRFVTFGRNMGSRTTLRLKPSNSQSNGNTLIRPLQRRRPRSPSWQGKSWRRGVLDADGSEFYWWIFFKGSYSNWTILCELVVNLRGAVPPTQRIHTQVSCHHDNNSRLQL